MNTRILVVDDLESHLYLAKSLLEPYGYEVVVATSHDEALAHLANSNSFDVILSDVDMPSSTGFDLIQKVKANSNLKGIPFIFLTAACWSEADKQKGLELGAAKFIFRPMDARAILTELEEVLPPDKRMSAKKNSASTTNA